MGYVKDISISNSTHLIEPILYASTEGSANAITFSISNFELVTGAVVTLKITITNAADATLKVNNTAAALIKYNGANIAAGALKANRVYSFVYDGTYWQLIGELDTDNNNYVQQSLTTDSNWHKVLLSYNGGGSATASISNNTNAVYGSQYIAVQPFTGTLRVTIYRVADNVELQYNSNDQSLDFVFI